MRRKILTLGIVVAILTLLVISVSADKDPSPNSAGPARVETFDWTKAFDWTKVCTKNRGEHAWFPFCDLLTMINTETSNRQAADTNLQKAMQDGHSALQAQLNNEVTARQAADDALSKQLSGMTCTCPISQSDLDALNARIATLEANTQCPTGLSHCGISCVDFQTNTNNCGSCGVVCSQAANSVPVCSGGSCSLTCNSGYGNCDGNQANGCEVNFQSDPTNCGACSHTCALPNVENNGCTNGQCTVLSCNAGYDNCNNLAADGCEVNLQTDVQNCGSCGNKCSSNNGFPSCSNGICSITCNPGFGDCDNNPKDGCEVDLMISTFHCGACGNDCWAVKLPNIQIPACSGGTCSELTCKHGYANCWGNIWAVGCPTNILYGDVNNCGSCGHQCPEAPTGYYIECSSFHCYQCTEVECTKID